MCQTHGGVSKQEMLASRTNTPGPWRLPSNRREAVSSVLSTLHPVRRGCRPSEAGEQPGRVAGPGGNMKKVMLGGAMRASRRLAPWAAGHLCREPKARARWGRGAGGSAVPGYGFVCSLSIELMGQFPGGFWLRAVIGQTRIICPGSAL